MKKRRSRLLALLMCLTMMLGTTSVVSAAEPEPVDLSEYGYTYVAPDKFGEMAYFCETHPLYDGGSMLEILPSEEYWNEWHDSNVVIPTRQDMHFVVYGDIIKSEGLDTSNRTMEVDPESVLITGLDSKCSKDLTKEVKYLINNSTVFYNFSVFKDILPDVCKSNLSISVGYEDGYTYEKIKELYSNLYVYVFKPNGTYTLVKFLDIPKYSAKYNENDYTCKVELSQEDGDTAKISVNWNFGSTGSVAGDFNITDEAGVVLKTETLNGASGSKDISVDIESNGTISYSFYTSHKIYTGSFDIDWYENEDVVTPEDVVNPKISASVNSEDATVTVTSDIEAILTFGDEVTDEYVTSYTFNVSESGTYKYSATTDKGGYSTSTVEVTLAEDGDGSTEEVPDPWEHWEEDEEDELAQTGLSKPVIVTVSTIMLVVSACILFFVRKRKVGGIDEK